ncbi:MAG: hypothetical protein EBR23_01120 [Planctomycetia bacterium]|nr:hypothetical protein [Planctomycetia bacterium]
MGTGRPGSMLTARASKPSTERLPRPTRDRAGTRQPRTAPRRSATAKPGGPPAGRSAGRSRRQPRRRVRRACHRTCRPTACPARRTGNRSRRRRPRWRAAPASAPEELHEEPVDVLLVPVRPPGIVEIEALHGRLLEVEASRLSPCRGRR